MNASVFERLGRRAGVADARRHLQRAELHGLADGDIEGDDAAGDLVEPGEQRALVAIFCDGGSEMISSPGCGEVSAGCGVPRG